MTFTPAIPEQLRCRVVVIDPSNCCVLALPDNAVPRLLEISVPSSARFAEASTCLLSEKHGLHTLQLAVLPSGDPYPDTRCIVHELLSADDKALALFSQVPLDQSCYELFNDQEMLQLREIAAGGSTTLGHFSGLGWIHDLLSRLGYEQSSRHRPSLRQLNQGINFCLLSITDDEGISQWFKAVGEPNVQEFALTLELTKQFPEFLPPLLMAIPEWNGWVSKGIIGTPLYQSRNLKHWEQAISVVATMQRCICQNTHLLYKAGAVDWTATRMKSLLGPFFLELSTAMENQTSLKAARLTATQLDQLHENLAEVLAQLETTELPNTLVHGDIGHGNIMMSANGPIFLDWAQTYIGHPFLCLEHLIADLKRCQPDLAAFECPLRRAYLRFWADYASESELLLASRLIPPAAALMAGMAAWSYQAGTPRISLSWPFLRMIARRAQREFAAASEVLL